MEERGHTRVFDSSSGADSWKQGPYELDIRFLVEATICAYILSPLGYLWLDFLNAWLPDRAPPSLASDEEATDTKSDSNDEKPTLNDEKAPLNMVNTIAKVVISQTIGGAWNTVLYIAIMGMLRGLDFEYILWQIQEVSESWKLREDYHDELLAVASNRYENFQSRISSTSDVHAANVGSNRIFGP